MHVAFMGIRKAYDEVSTEGLWGISESVECREDYCFLKRIYNRSNICVWLNGGMCKWLPYICGSGFIRTLYKSVVGWLLSTAEPWWYRTEIATLVCIWCCSLSCIRGGVWVPWQVALTVCVGEGCRKWRRARTRICLKETGSNSTVSVWIDKN